VLSAALILRAKLASVTENPGSFEFQNQLAAGTPPGLPAERPALQSDKPVLLDFGGETVYGNTANTTP
jgi:hypothetical protein